MLNYEKKDSLTINLGRLPHYHREASFFTSILRRYRRYSRLHRNIICLVLILVLLYTVYVLPQFFSSIPQESEFDSIQKKRDWPKQIKTDAKQEEEVPINPKFIRPIKIISDENSLQRQPPPIFNEEEMKLFQHQKQKTPTHHKVDYDFFKERYETVKQKAVKEAFVHAWNAYKKYSWGYDELRPITKTHSTWFDIGLSIVDSLDTMVILGLKSEYEEAREWVRNELKFNKDRSVNLFEVTIRALGGLLGVYHLTGDEMFKEKATLLGDKLMPCFNTQSKVPYSDVNLMTGKAHSPSWGPDSSTSEISTIQLEFRDLSRVTGDEKYEDVAKKVSDHLHELPKTSGLVPIFINVNSGQFRSSSHITLGARGDSYYEYLLKQWIQTGQEDNYFKQDYLESVQGVQDKLVRQSQPNKLTFIGELLGGKTFSPKMDHLVCFYPGTLALGTMFGLNKDHLILAKEMMKTCYQMYARMPTKLSPEITYFNLVPSAPEDLIVKPLDAHNLLRPETVESLFYLYRITGDKIYREWGWQIFQAFEKHAKIPGAGYSSINNVKMLKPTYKDKLESFFLSETLKYFYLLFSDDPDLLPLDKYLFNTEAHPLPIYSS